VKENRRIYQLFFARQSDHYQSPESRADKAYLKDAVRRGVYQVDARKVAQALLKKLFIDNES
jgi:anti-sigma28 factor (negative regulator of flagellin synthesis)